MALQMLPRLAKTFTVALMNLMFTSVPLINCAAGYATKIIIVHVTISDSHRNFSFKHPM